MELPRTSAYLILDDPTGKRELALDGGDVWKIGRSTACTVGLKDETISRNHAMIQRTDLEEYYLIDLGSQNGSFVNDRRVSTPVALKHGDRISVGRTVIVFKNPSQSSPLRPPSFGDYGSTRQIFAQRLVTVLVVDIRDYTVLANNTDQSVLCQVIGNWFKDAERIMQQHGSTVQKYIGDAVMAVWVHENLEQEQGDILQIIRALVQFVDATETLSQRFGFSQGIRVGAGLNTGAAAMGSPGSGDMTALGECVNAAFRLEEATKELKVDVVLGQVTFDSLRSLPAAAEHFRAHQLHLKGYTSPATTWATSFAQLRSFLGTLPQGSSRTAHAPRF